MWTPHWMHCVTRFLIDSASNFLSNYVTCYATHCVTDCAHHFDETCCLVLVVSQKADLVHSCVIETSFVIDCVG